MAFKRSSVRFRLAPPIAEIDQHQIRTLPCRSENLTSHCTFNLYGRLVTLSIVQSAERDGFMFP